MYRVVAVVCIGAILISAFVPGAAALYVALPQLSGITLRLDESAPQRFVRQPSLSPALSALVRSHHMPRASLPAARS